MPATIDTIVTFCDSRSIEQAAGTASALGWLPAPKTVLDEWRKHFTSHNGREAVVQAWRQADHDGTETLSFWVVAGPGGYKACSYTTANAADLFDVVSAQFGPPTSLEKHDFGSTALWKRTGTEASFSRVGTQAVLYVTRFDP